MHKTACKSLGGYLVSYNTAAEQVVVENELNVPTDYYLGVEQQGSSWMLADGTFLGNTTPSNSSPYKHWWVPACSRSSLVCLASTQCWFSSRKRWSKNAALLYCSLVQCILSGQAFNV